MDVDRWVAPFVHALMGQMMHFHRACSPVVAVLPVGRRRQAGRCPSKRGLAGAGVEATGGKRDGGRTTRTDRPFVFRSWPKNAVAEKLCRPYKPEVDSGMSPSTPSVTGELCCTMTWATRPRSDVLGRHRRRVPAHPQPDALQTDRQYHPSLNQKTPVVGIFSSVRICDNRRVWISSSVCTHCDSNVPNWW